MGAMTQESEIARIRSEIDAIDVNVHDQLKRRVALAEEMAAAKDNVAAGQPRMRPGREAAILRSLYNRHDGPLSFPVVARIWRELINANLRVEGNFSVALCEADDNIVADLARAQFSDLTPRRTFKTAQDALNAACDNVDTIAVLPFNAEADWWALLAREQNTQLKIIACLPFLLGPDDGIAAVAVGALDREDTGDDVSLAIVEADGPIVGENTIA